MTDLEAKLERFEALAAECDLIGKLATDDATRQLYLRTGLHYRELAGDMRAVIATQDPVRSAPGISGRDSPAAGARSTH